MTISSGLKAKFSFYSALLFFLIANPVTFKFTNSLMSGIATNGCPTAFGFLLHTIVFFLASYGIMSFPRDPY